MDFHKIRTRFIRQDDPLWTKKWFQGADADLFIWLNDKDVMERFQLCLSRDGGDVVDWRRGMPGDAAPQARLRTGTVRARGIPFDRASPIIDFEFPPVPSKLHRGLELVRRAECGLTKDQKQDILDALERALQDGEKA